MSPIPWERVQRLLAIVPDDDVLALAPALRALRDTGPKQTLLLTTSRGARLARLLRWDGGILTWDTSVDPMSFGGDEEAWSASTAELVDALKAGEIDAAIVFAGAQHAPHVWRYLAGLAGIEHRFGPVSHDGEPVAPARAAVPERRHVDLLRAAGLPTAQTRRQWTAARPQQSLAAG